MRQTKVGQRLKYVSASLETYFICEIRINDDYEYYAVVVQSFYYMWKVGQIVADPENYLSRFQMCLGQEKSE